MDTFPAIIDQIGYRDLAAALGLSVMHIRVMKSRSSVPTEYWPQLIEAAKAKGLDLTFENLLHLRSERMRPSHAQAGAAA